MATLDRWQQTLEEILEDYANLPYPYPDVQTYVVISQDRKHFFLIHEGWHRERRIHGLAVHVEIREDKIWIHYDGIENGISADLTRSGISKHEIVLAFHPPYVREHTGYGCG